MTFDYRRLKGRIKEKFSTQHNFSRSLGISEQCLSKRLKGSTTFEQHEIRKAADLLKLDDEEIGGYFFKV